VRASRSARSAANSRRHLAHDPISNLFPLLGRGRKPKRWRMRASQLTLPTGSRNWPQAYPSADSAEACAVTMTGAPARLCDRPIGGTLGQPSEGQGIPSGCSGSARRDALNDGRSRLAPDMTGGVFHPEAARHNPNPKAKRPGPARRPPRHNHAGPFISPLPPDVGPV
jgi:hypothetical protein